MKLYLTSTASKVLDKLVPLLDKSPKDLRVAFIPTAGDLYSEKPWMEAGRQKLLEIGFEVFDLDLKEKDATSLRDLLSKADIIFVAGGNTSYLLEKAQQSGFIEIVKDLVQNEGKVYIGSSAGSLLASPNIEIDKIYDDGKFGKKLESYEGLGFVPFVILPHADNLKYASYLEKIFKEYGHKYEFKKLNDNQAIFVNNNKIQMI